MTPKPPKPPRAYPSQTVERVVADPTLTRDQKVERLVEMSRDAQALEVASGEGMTGEGETGEASGLRRIHRALRELGAEDQLPTDGAP